MTHTPLVTRVDHHIQDVALALDLASTALIRAQELADQDPTGAAPAWLAQATATLQGNVRMLADMLKPPSSRAPANAHHPTTIARAGRSWPGRTAGTRPLTAPTPEPQYRRHGMGEHDLHRHVQISDDHGAVASADVTITQQTVRTARASLRAAAGHLAPGSRARLVDAVLDLPELHNGGRLEAAFPLGDSETLCRLRQRCTEVTTHPAGSTVLVEATIGPVPAFGRAADWDELGSYAHVPA